MRIGLWVILTIYISTAWAHPRYSLSLQHRQPTRDRPTLSGIEFTIASTSDFFLVHYTTTGTDSTTADYAISVAQWADSSRTRMVTELSWPDPPSDLEGAYDIYLLGLGPDVSGYTQLDFPTAGSYPDQAAASYMVLATGMDMPALQASAAHHFNQACQYAYSANEFGAWMEQTAGWIEESVFPDANEWTLTTGNYLTNCHKYLYVSDGFTEHGALLWPKYLAESTGDPDIVRTIWLGCALTEGTNTISATEQEILNSGGEGIEEEYQIFTSWNYLTGPRDDGSHYQEGDAITGEVGLLATHSTYPASGSSALVTAPYGLGCNYIEFTNSGEPLLYITVSADPDCSPWGAGILTQDLGGFFTYHTFDISSSTGEGDTLLTEWSSQQKAVLIVQNLRLWAEPQADFSYTASLGFPPTIPTNLTTRVYTDYLQLAWTGSTDPDNDLAGYHVYRGEAAYLGISAMTRVGDAVTDEDPGTPGVQWTDANSFGADVVGDLSVNYFYRVTAVDGGGNESDASNCAGEVDNLLDDGP